MPCVTRAVLQAAAAVPLPATPPVTKRQPLGEISGNQEELPAAVEDPEQILKANKGPGKGKKGKGSKKSKEHEEAANNEKSKDVLPDENESETSSAVEDACQDLLREQSKAINQMVTHDMAPYSPPSPAALEAAEQLSSTTPEISVMATQGGQATVAEETNDPQPASVSPEQYLEKDIKRSEIPKQMSCRPDVDKEDTSEQKGDASSQQRNRSPAKAVLRPEDSIEAIDKFEDEMEKVGEIVPAINSSAQKSKLPKQREIKLTVAKNVQSNHASTPLKPRRGPTLGRTTLEADTKAAALKKKGMAVHPAALHTSQATKADPKVRQVSNNSTASDQASVAAKKRVSSIHKAPFMPAKSTKPLTRSDFELPGEAVARKLKEAREKRMKREEGKTATKPAFRARPVRISQAPVVQPTATSRARISMAKGKTPAVPARKDASPKSRVTPRPSTVSATGKRLSMLSVNQRSAPAPANSSARVSRGPPSSTVRQSLNATDAAQLKAKGKEVFNRGQVEHDERERMRKDKEEAAKKARAEAAERGRIASRQWAEKQKARKIAEKKGKSEMATNDEASVPAA